MGSLSSIKIRTVIQFRPQFAYQTANYIMPNNQLDIGGDGSMAAFNGQNSQRTPEYDQWRSSVPQPMVICFIFISVFQSFFSLL